VGLKRRNNLPNSKEAEIEAARRRQKNYAKRQRARGLRQRSFWLDDEESDQIKRIIKRWRGEPTDLPAVLAEAADILKP
jgi:hypothetical protein